MLDALAARGRFVQALLRGANELPLREKRMLRDCLDLPWKPTGRISMDDPVTRNGVYDAIVRPLEEELEYLFWETV